MIKIEKKEIVGFDAAIRGMRNPMNSWDKSDSFLCNEFECCDECSAHENKDLCFEMNTIGKNDIDLMLKLSKAGSDHRKYLRMIAVYADIIAPLYWWKEFDTYKVGTVANSCSTMHMIQAKEFTFDDFSVEHLSEGENGNLEMMNCIITCLNVAREWFIKTKDKDFWWQMIQLLPSSYNQKRTVMMNYEVLANIYHGRKEHKLDEWKELCKWIEMLPCSQIITESR